MIAMRLGVHERERGGVASLLGPPPLFPVPGPIACVRTGGHLAPQGPASSETPQATGGHRAEGWAPGLVNPATRASCDHGPLTEAAVNGDAAGGSQAGVWRGYKHAGSARSLPCSWP